jgi:hypothetical protein
LKLEKVTESNFFEKGYLAANKDVYDAVNTGQFTTGYDHFKLCGKFESRWQVSLSDLSVKWELNFMTRELFATEIIQNTDGGILEIGPLNNPLITSDNCKYFDLLDTNSLKRKAIANNLDPRTVPQINFHEPNGDLSVVKEKFESIVSAHVIEHQPDLIRHLKQVSDLCQSIGSRYWMIVPDKRFCFDHFIPESRISEIIREHDLNTKKPSKFKVLEHLALTTHNDALRHWRGDHGTFGENLESRWTIGLKHIQDTNDKYIDAHCWQFSPESFSYLIDMLFRLGYIDFECKQIIPTAVYELEFFAVLEKSRN